jgi:hypothetical protein
MRADSCRGRAELKGWNAGVNAHWNLTDNWYLSGRGGYFRGDLKGGYVNAFDPTTKGYTVTHWKRRCRKAAIARRPWCRSRQFAAQCTDS